MTQYIIVFRLQNYKLGLFIPLLYIIILPATKTFKLNSDLNFTKI